MQTRCQSHHSPAACFEDSTHMTNMLPEAMLRDSAGALRLFCGNSDTKLPSLACLWPVQVIDTTFPVGEGEGGLSSALDRVAKEAEAAVDGGFSFLVLSDRSFGPGRVPVSPLLAVGEWHRRLLLVRPGQHCWGCNQKVQPGFRHVLQIKHVRGSGTPALTCGRLPTHAPPHCLHLVPAGRVHHHLVQLKKRSRIGLVVESGEPREVHQFCTLVRGRERATGATVEK
jgi:hypothetical protein